MQFLSAPLLAAAISISALPLSAQELQGPPVNTGMLATEQVAIGYCETVGSHLMVSSRILGTGNSLVRGSLVLADGTTINNFGLFSTGAIDIDQIRIDGVQSSLHPDGYFLVVFRYSTGATNLIRVMGVNATTGAGSLSVTVASGNVHDPDVWGVGTAGYEGGGTIVWADDDNGVFARTVGILADGSITLGGPPGLALGTKELWNNPNNQPLGRVRLAKSAPFDTALSGYGRNMVFWESENSSGSPQVLLTTLAAAETPLQPISTVYAYPGHSPAVDGNGSTFHLAFRQGTGTLSISRLRFSTSISNPTITEFAFAATSTSLAGADQTPDVAWLGDRFACSYVDVALSPTVEFRETNSLNVLDSFSSVGVALDERLSIVGNHPSDNGAMGHDCKLTWIENGTTWNQDAGAFTQGLVTEAAPACGQSTLTLSGGALATDNPDFSMTVDYSIGGLAPFLLNIVPGAPQIVPCGPCTLVLGNGNLQVQVGNSSSKFELPIPDSINLIGYRATVQGGVLGPVGMSAGGCSIAPRLHLTEVFDMTILN